MFSRLDLSQVQHDKNVGFNSPLPKRVSKCSWGLRDSSVCGGCGTHTGARGPKVSKEPWGWALFAKLAKKPVRVYGALLFIRSVAVDGSAERNVAWGDGNLGLDILAGPWSGKEGFSADFRPSRGGSDIAVGRRMDCAIVLLTVSRGSGGRGRGEALVMVRGSGPGPSVRRLGPPNMQYPLCKDHSGKKQYPPSRNGV